MNKKYMGDVVDNVVHMMRINGHVDREKGAKAYDIGVRLMKPYRVLGDDNVLDDWWVLNEYLNAAESLYYARAWTDQAAGCGGTSPHFDKGIHIMAYGYQLGVRAERERRKAKRTKEKAAKRGNAGRQG